MIMTMMNLALDGIGGDEMKTVVVRMNPMNGSGLRSTDLRIASDAPDQMSLPVPRRMLGNSLLRQLSLTDV